MQLVSSCTQINPGCLEVHIFNIGAGKVGVLGAYDTIPYDFGRDHVSSACSELKRVISQVASYIDEHTVRIFLLGMMIDHNAGVGDCSIAWDFANVSVQKKKYGVSAFGNASTSFAK